MPARSDRLVAVWLALLLFGVYLLVFSGRITSSDGLAMYAVTDSFIKRGEFSTDQLWTLFRTKSIAAPDGEVYSKYGYGTSLLAVPFYTLALFVPFAGMMQVTLLASAAAVAVTGALVYLAARRLEFSALVAVSAALLFGIATPAFVYAKEFWSESFAPLALFGAFYFVLVYRRSRQLRDAALSGVLLGLAVAVRTTNAVLVPLYALYAFVEYKPSQIRWRDMIGFGVPVVLFGLAVLAYNAVRFGNPLTTGYRPDEDFSNPLLLGIYGLLFSPGKGLLVYAPFLAALPFGIWQFYRQFRRETVFMLLVFAVNLVLFSVWYYWWGGTNWAARFLVPTLPFLVLFCAPLLDLILNPGASSRARPAYGLLCAVFGALVGLSVVNELAGVSVNSLTYRLRTLNLSPNPDWDAMFVPALSPLLGHWQTLKLTNADFAWVRVTPASVPVDWLALGLTLALVLYCGWMLVRALRGRTLPQGAVWLSLAVVVGATGVALARYADDPRLGGNDGYAELVRALEREAHASDVLILNDETPARYLLNANRARLRWYGLSRDPARWDEPTQALIHQLLARYPRVWFAYDESVDAPNPMREWFQANLEAVRVLDFNSVHLILYRSP